MYLFNGRWFEELAVAVAAMRIKADKDRDLAKLFRYKPPNYVIYDDSGNPVISEANPKSYYDLESKS